MKHLPLPATPAEEKAVLTKLGKQALWAPHIANWEIAYSTYQKYGGDPHQLVKSAFDDATSQLQYNLYDGRRRTKPLDAIRRQTGLLSCPMCGSPSQGSLDHYLPREAFGEFSIMRANLVPACSHCNSDEKGTVFKGPSPARLIHPYYDNWCNNPLWQVRIVPPYAAATFVPDPLAGLPNPQRQIVAFQLGTLLGKQFRTAMSNWWSTLPEALAVRLSEPVALAALEAQLQEELLVSEKTTGANSWMTSAYRGLACDPAAIADLLARL
jgi:hypothetical protein